MKRDDDYLRELLLEIEASEDTLFFIIRSLDGGDRQNKQWFHAQLLCNHGYLIAGKRRGVSLDCPRVPFHRFDS